tara:strand:- start:494 stop:1264 length:771 start_codon:yes stop_codon:yes gene_type:complete
MLTDKIVLITGGSGVLGAEFVRTVVQNNGMAIIADIDDQRSLDVKNLICHAFEGALIDSVTLDITSSISIEKTIEYLSHKYGKIDALVNNAYPRNQHYGRHFFDVTYDDFCENLGMNMGGCFLASQLFGKYFKLQGHGNIVNISSIYGVVAPKFEIYDETTMTMPVEYAAIKSGLIHLTKYMAKYFSGMGIRVNSISPGGILDKQPTAFINRYGEHCLEKGLLDKSDINGTLAFLLSDMSKYLNGQNIIVDDGFSL